MGKASVSRDDFKTESEYRKALKEYERHYDKKAKVEGGWLFFETAEDYRIWKQQK